MSSLHLSLFDCIALKTANTMLLLKSPLRFVQSANVGDEFLFLLKELPDDVVWLMSDASPQSFEGWSWSLDPRWFRSGPLVTLVGETEDPFTARAVLHKTGQEPPTYEHHRTYPECVVRYLPAVTSASVLHTGGFWELLACSANRLSTSWSP